MKIVKSVLLALSLSISFSAIANEITSVIAGNGEYAPYSGKKLRNGGIITNITTSAFAEVGVSVDYEYTSWTRVMDLTKSAKFDLTPGWRKNKEREKTLLFSDPIIDDEIYFFHLKSLDFDWTNLFDLDQYDIGSVRTYFYGDEFKRQTENGRLKNQKTSDDLYNFKKLLRKRIDIMPVSRFVGKNILRTKFQAWENDAVTFHPKPVYSSSLYLLVSKKHPNGQEIINTFNEGLKKLKASGKYQKILDELLAQ
ncbi:substrate-binding periplasmic protein [Leucothrix arctica]|uniref:Solute-binding protein family 3/N-terminal domain-containing protein n=1 Tax=Leucothrix arctica TaxID=1481894 RepID=A0A317CN77_9GAMM|nr:transporter substrate-binding domain-containing protein [Leucothrix arctica]PWQ99651.1 hypothetical protein DKT75_00845 [Leucothrix arctica]